MVYKPGSVHLLNILKNAMIIRLGLDLHLTSSNLPERAGKHSCPFIKRTSFLFGLAPGGVYPAKDVTAFAVRSYRPISPLLEC